MILRTPRILRLISVALMLDARFIITTPAAVESPPSEIQLTGSGEHYVAIDNVCAWPNLTVLSDGTIVAAIFNRPSHGAMEGSVEAWASQDGRFWKKSGVVAPNEPQTNRMHVAAGLAKNGDLIMLVTGFSNVQQPDRPKQLPFRDALLPAWVCRSSDGGRTWTQLKEFAPGYEEEGWRVFTPFGDIIAGENGALHASCYQTKRSEPPSGGKPKVSYRTAHLRSDDDGKTWRATSLISANHNETALFHLGGTNWLAAAREESAQAMDLFRSSDDGQSWTGPQRVTERGELNADLARLQDGRLLLTYGNRAKEKFGVLAKLSNDQGLTWGAPIRLAHTSTWDCGYPSSVQRTDGTVVTAYYSSKSPQHTRYHMGVVVWTPQAIDP